MLESWSKRVQLAYLALAAQTIRANSRGDQVTLLAWTLCIADDQAVELQVAQWTKRESWQPILALPAAQEHRSTLVFLLDRRLKNERALLLVLVVLFPDVLVGALHDLRPPSRATTLAPQYRGFGLDFHGASVVMAPRHRATLRPALGSSSRFTTT